MPENKCISNDEYTKLIETSVIESSIDKSDETIENRGTGAGGSNTNKNGLPFEELTEIKENTRYKFKGNIQIHKKTIDIIDIDNNDYIKVKKGDLKLYMESIDEYNKCERTSQPDECYVDIEKKIINVIEKKFQQRSGSCDEKIQTGLFKKEFYEEQYPNYTIKYCYCLNNWFKKDKYEPDMRFLKKYNINVFWGDDESYTNNIIDWIVNSL